MLKFITKRKQKARTKQHLFIIILMLLSLALVFLTLYQSKKFRRLSGRAGGFGVSPPYLYFDNLSPGETSKKQIRVLRNTSGSSEQISVKANPPEIMKYLNLIPKKGPSFAPEITRAVLEVEASIPRDAYSGCYKGYLDLYLAPANASGVKIAVGARIDFHLSVINGRVPLRPLIIKNEKTYNRLKGRFIIKTEDKGKIYYISSENKEIFYLADKQKLWQLISEQGLGIADDWLKAIPLQLSMLHGKDADKDGLSDNLEQALGTNKNEADSDKDGFGDFMEIKNGYDPLRKNKALDLSYQIAGANSGRLLIQVDNRGQAWYVNPKNLRRYYLPDQDTAWQITKKLSIGISSQDYENLFN